MNIFSCKLCQGVALIFSEMKILCSFLTKTNRVVTGPVADWFNEFSFGIRFTNLFSDVRLYPDEIREEKKNEAIRVYLTAD